VTIDREELGRDLAVVLNRHSVENVANVPDFVLATYLLGCLDTFHSAVGARDAWYGISPAPGKGEAP
jgi:hypothetical protein